MKLNFINANPNVKPVGKEKQKTIFNYFTGKEEDWKTDIPSYSRIVYSNLWDGVDLVYTGTVNELKYEFVVKPGADPASIRLSYQGVSSLSVLESGELEIATPVGILKDGIPFAFQQIDGEQKEVSMGYAIDENSSSDDIPFGFKVGQFDKNKPLILDPALLVYCGFIGGENEDYGCGITVDCNGCTLITGSTESSETTFPNKVGPDITFNGKFDIFVAKLNSQGTEYEYCGFIGGDGYDDGKSISSNSTGCVFITGSTSSDETTFPVITGPSLTFKGHIDVFVAKLNAQGTGLEYCGYIGGDRGDNGYDISVDSVGCAFVTGRTNSSEGTFPVKVGPDLTFNNGNHVPDAFVAKVNAQGTELEYCGYIGGLFDDIGYSIDVDDYGCSYITGETGSSEVSFPVKIGPDLTTNSYIDAFVAKVNSRGTDLEYCGFIGGSSKDIGRGIAVDDSGCAYITGSTGSSEITFPVKVGPDLTFNSESDVFVSKVNSKGTDLEYCGYIGGAEDESGYDISIDSFGAVYVTGETNSSETTFPVKSGPDLTFNGYIDAFVAKVSAQGDNLLYCGYIGGDAWDRAEAITVDISGAVYLTGWTKSNESTFPVITGPDQTFNGGDYDAFVAKIVEYPDQEKLFNVPTDRWILHFDDNNPANGVHDPKEQYYASSSQPYLEDMSSWIASAWNLLIFEGFSIPYLDYLRDGGAVSPNYDPWDNQIVAVGGGYEMTFDDGGYQHWVFHHAGKYSTFIRTATPGGSWSQNPIDWCIKRIAEGQGVGLTIWSGSPSLSNPPGSANMNGGDLYHAITIWEIDTVSETVLITDSDDLLFGFHGPRTLKYEFDGNDWNLINPYPGYYSEAYVNYAVALVQNSLQVDYDKIFTVLGGKRYFNLNAGSQNANRAYALLGSISGTSPGTPLPGGKVTLPLNYDSFTSMIIANFNTTVFSNFLGLLDSEGKAAAILNSTGPIDPAFIGIVMHFAFTLNKPWNCASNAVCVEIAW